MTDNVDAKAEQYVNMHIEPSTPSLDINNTLIENPDNSFSLKLLNDRNVKTPFFDFEGAFTDINVDEFIDKVFAEEKADLRANEDTMTDREILGRLASIHGGQLGYGLRLLGSEGHPPVLLNKLDVTGNNKALNLVELLPPEWQIVWNPTGRKEASANDIDRKVITANGDITSPQGLMILLHEIGHAVDLSKDPERIPHLQRAQGLIIAPKREEWKAMGYPEDIIDGLMEALGETEMTNADLQLFLEAERNAWAFSLKKMSELISDKETLRELQKYIHEVPMKLQSDVLRSRGFIK